MEVAALVISIAAAFFAGGALIHSIWTSNREARDRAEELGLVRTQLADERARHEEQMELERQRHLDDRSAELVAAQGSSSGGAQTDQYTINLTNAGRTTAHSIVVRGVGENDEDLTAEHPAATALIPGDRLQLTLHVPREISDSGRRIAIACTWLDGTGERAEILLEELRRLR